MSPVSFSLRGLKIAAASLALAGLAACAAPFNADVSRFESQLPAPQGQSFAIVAEDPALAGGLEFAQYAGYVAKNLRDLGFTEAASPQDANLLVRFDYGIDTGREKLESSPFGYGYRDPFYRGWYDYQPVVFRDRRGRGHVSYIPTRSWGYGFYDPFFDSGSDSYTVFTSGISLKIDNATDGKRLFEGKAQALSTSNRLQYLVPNLVEAMFTDFPGDSGKTVRISVAPENQPVQRR